MEPARKIEEKSKKTKTNVGVYYLFIECFVQNGRTPVLFVVFEDEYEVFETDSFDFRPEYLVRKKKVRKLVLNVCIMYGDEMWLINKLTTRWLDRPTPLVPVDAPTSSSFRFFRGPMAARAVLLASWRLISSFSACMTSLAFCLSLLNSTSSPFDRLLAAFMSFSRLPATR